MLDRIQHLSRELVGRFRKAEIGRSGPKPGILPLLPLGRTPAVISADKSTSIGNWWFLSLAALVFLPSLVFFLYAALWQSEAYESEARVTVRGAQEFRGTSTDASSIVSKITSGGGVAKSSIQDAYIVLNYIKSAAIIDDLGGLSYMEEYFGKKSIDYFSRLRKSATVEMLLKYWLRHVTVSVDTVTGIVTLKVAAFTPSNALQIAQDVLTKSEHFVNSATERSRRDAVSRSEQEVARSAERLATAREKLTLFRDKTAVFDPTTQAKSVAEIIAKLTMDKISLENSLATLEGTLTPTSPTLRIYEAKLSAINQQILEFSKVLTNHDDLNALSARMGSYERLKLDEQFSELMYTISQSAYERARQELQRQQLYLVIAVPPALPQTATYPKIFASTLLLLAVLSVIWSICALVAASIADQLE